MIHSEDLLKEKIFLINLFFLTYQLIVVLSIKSIILIVLSQERVFSQEKMS